MSGFVCSAYFSQRLSELDRCMTAEEAGKIVKKEMKILSLTQQDAQIRDEWVMAIMGEDAGATGQTEMVCVFFMIWGRVRERVATG